MLAGKRLDQALELANAALAFDNKNPSALALKAAVQLKLNNRGEAKHDAQLALDVDPKNVEALIVLAAERMESDDIEGALLIIDRPGLGHENSLAVLIFKLSLFEKAKEVKQTESLLRKLVALYPKEPMFQRRLIQLWVDQKRYDDAEKELRALADANPSDFEAGLNVVRFLQQFKGPAAARAAPTSAIVWPFPRFFRASIPMRWCISRPKKCMFSLKQLR